MRENKELEMPTRCSGIYKPHPGAGLHTIWIIFLCSLLFSACGNLEIGIEDIKGTQTEEAFYQDYILTQTEQAGGIQLVTMPTQLPSTTTQVPSPTPPPPLKVKIFLILIDDNGQFGKQVGCGDSVVPVDIEIPYTQAVLRSTLESLLSLEDANYQNFGLYNALNQSKLIVDDVLIRNGEAVVSFSGELILGGVCDNPRVQAQLEETILQFSTVLSVTIYINGVPLSDILSLQG